MELSLPQAADRFPIHQRRLEAASRAGMNDPEVLGMLVGGSFASGEADEFSDLDMQLVVKDGRVDELVPKLRAMANEVGPVVAAFFAEHIGLPHMLIVLYEDLVHADFEPIQISEIGSRNAGLATHLLWERDHGLSTAVGAKYEEDQSAELAWLEDRIWTWGWYVQTKVLRGELYEAIGGLQYIRDRVLFRLLAMLREERPSSARRVESRVGPLKEKFAATIPQLTRESTMNALKSSIHLYVELTDLLHKKFSIEPADQARSAVLHALEQGLTWRSEDESVSRSVLRQGSKHHRRSRRT